ncbi:uncharacterized protein [Littorina saxatilis]|uniref:Uncharacterized protein n=1 Tax=Littorina saxatilis TaxID=31220 RepID=A0AAN9BWU2_9CAEN
MNLDEVRHQLTAGFERVNSMKNSTARIEQCRISLRMKRESMLTEVKSMMTQMAAKLHQLQLFMEATVKERVAKREKLLDANLKEIHEGYAKLVQVCVEADQVLRGRNDDLLGRSCQRLFNNFETAKCKLDTAEKIDIDGMLGFELQSNTKRFLSSNYVARLLSLDRLRRPLEADEFWVDAPHCQTVNTMTDKKGRVDTQHSNHVECRNNNRSSAFGEPQARISSGSPQQPLETIDELPEDGSGYVASRTSTPRPRPGLMLDRVSIREMDLCVSEEQEKCQKNKIVMDNDIPPPPGFSKLVIADIPDIDAQSIHTKFQRQMKSNRSINPLSSPDISTDSSSAAGTPGRGCRGDVSSGASNPDTSPASAGRYSSSSFVSSDSKSFSSSAQSLRNGTSLNIELLKSEVRTREEEDFVWDSDDSDEIASPQSGSSRSAKSSSGATSAQEGSKCGSGQSTKPQSVSGRQVTKSRYNYNSSPETLASKAPYTSELGSESSQPTVESPESFSEPSHWDSPVTGFSKLTLESQNVTQPSHAADSSYSKGTQKAAPATQKGFLGSPNSKNVALKTLKNSETSGTYAVDASRSKSCRLPVALDINIVVGHSGDKHQHPIEDKLEHGVDNQESSKSLPLKDSMQAVPQNIKPESKDTDTRESLAEKVLEQKSQAHVMHIKRELTETVVKHEIKTQPVRKGEQVEAEVPKTNEVPVPRPIKTRSKRLDLSRMLVHVGGSLFEIGAKCVEKIRGDFDHPIGVCTNSKGDVIVADTGNNIIKVCNNGRIVNKFGADLRMRRPSAIVVNKKDEVFVKDDFCLYHFDAEGRYINTIGKRMMNSPYGLGMTRDGQLVVVDALYSNARIHIIEQRGKIDTYPFHPLSSRYDDSKCRFLAVHGEEVLTSDLGRSCLYLTNLKGELLQTLGRRGKRPGELNDPAGVAVDSVGNWVVADSKNHRVQVFDPNGYFMATVQFGGDAIRRPSGIHLTSDGLLYVINYMDSIIKVYKLGGS